MTAADICIDDVKTELARQIIEAIILSVRIGVPTEDIVNKYVFELKDIL